MFSHFEQISGAALYPNLKMYIDHYNYNMLVPRTNGVYCLFCHLVIDRAEECRLHVETDKHKARLRNQAYVKTFTENIVRHINDNCFHCGICNDLILEEELKNHIHFDMKHGSLKKFFRACAEYLLNNQNYHQKFIADYKQVELENDTMLLPHKNWNMCLLYPRIFFCMLCERSGNVDCLKQHMEGATHLKKLSHCKILNEYGNCVVRMINDNYNHCGVCNMYLRQGATKGHMRREPHAANFTRLLEITNKAKIIVERKTQSIVREKDNTIDVKDIDSLKYNIVIKYKGINYCLNVLSFNMIVKNKKRNSYLCMCCQKILANVELYDHLRDEEHKNRLVKIEIVTGFNQEFLRKLKPFWAHCAMCNIRVPYKTDQIRKHFGTVRHKHNFKKKLGLSSIKSRPTAVEPYSDSIMLFYNNTMGRYTKRVYILGKRYLLTLPTFGVWHTIKDWGVSVFCCMACQTPLVGKDVRGHAKSVRHKENMRNCIVLESYGTHYLRTINQSRSVYCTFCIVNVDFLEIDSHINSETHKERKKYSIFIDVKNNIDYSNNTSKDEIEGFFTKGTMTNQNSLINQNITMDLNKNLKQAMKNSAKGSVGDSKIIRLNEKLSVEESNECMPNPNGLLGLDDFKQDSRGKHNFAIEFAHSSGISTSENELAITDVIIAERDKLNDNKPSLNTAKTVESNDVVVNEGVILAKELILGRVHKSARDKILERLVIQTKQNTSPSSPKNATDEVTISRHDIHADSHFLSDSNCVILNCRHSDVLVTCKAWNCIKEKYAFCNVCQVNLQTGVEEHCAELTHETKLVESVCEWSEGAFMRELSRNRIHCLICDVVFGRFLLEVHIKSILHSKNFKKTKALAEDMMKRIPNGTENAPSETRENIATEVKNTIFMVVPFKSLTEEFEPQNAQKSNRIVLVKHLEACAGVDGRKTDEYFLLEFDTERILLTYNCWNSVTENRNCCLLCSSELLESVAEHCNGYVHSMNIKRKIVTHNFLRLINSTKTYCLICNEVSSPTEMEEHLKTGLHKKNLKRARTQAVKNQNGGYKLIKYGELLKEQFCARKRIQNKVRAINIARRMSNLYVEDVLEYDTLEWDELPPYKCDRRHKRIRQVYGIHKSASLQIQTDGQLISRNENLSVVSPKKPWGNINWFQYAYCSLCKDNVDFNEIDSHCKSEMHEQKRKYNLKKSGKKKMEKSNGSSIVVTKLENASDDRNAQLADKKIPLATKRQKGHIYPKLTTNLDRKMDGTCRALLNEEVNTMNKAKSKDNIVEEVTNDCYDAIEKGIEAGVKTRICNDSATDGEKNEKILKKYFEEITMDMSYPETDAAAAKSLLKGYRENTSNAFIEEQEHEASVKVRTKGWVTLQLGGRAMTITSHSYHGVYLRSLNTMGCVLCGVLKVPNEHILSKQHLNRLNGLKFKGVHLIRYLSKSSVHCAPCHRIVAVATLKDHFHSEDHERNVILASEVPGAVVLEEDCGESEISKSNECIKSEASVVQDVPFENDDVASQHVGLTVNSRTSPHTQIYSSSSMSESESTSYHRNTSIENIEHLQPRLANFEDHADANETEPVANIALICNVCNVYIPTFQQKLLHSLSSQHVANFRAFRSSSASQTVIADSIFTQIDKCHEKTRSLASIATPLPDSAATYVCTVCNFRTLSLEQKIIHKITAFHYTSRTDEMETLAECISFNIDFIRCKSGPRNKDNYFCFLCRVNMPTWKCRKDHERGSRHRKNLMALQTKIGNAADI